MGKPDMEISPIAHIENRKIMEKQQLGRQGVYDKRVLRGQARGGTPSIHSRKLPW